MSCAINFSGLTILRGAVRVVSTRPLFYVLKHILGQKNTQKCKKIKKNKKKCEKICIYQKKVLPLHRI